MKRVLRLTFVFLLWSLPLSAQQLRIYHIDVEQASATLFVAPSGKTLLVDSGKNGMGQRIQTVMARANVTTIDFFVDTHYHEDHYGGIDDLVELGVPVGEAYDRGGKDSLSAAKLNEATFQDYQAAVGNRAHPLIPGMTLPLDPLMTVTCISSGGVVIGEDHPVVNNDENNLSISLLITLGSFRYFIGGDIQSPTEQKIADRDLVKDVDVYIADHHGSDTSSILPFIQDLSPQVILVSNGDNAGFHHPRQSVLTSFTLLPGPPAVFQTNKCTKGPPCGNVDDAFIGDPQTTDQDGTITLTADFPTHSYTVAFDSGVTRTFQFRSLPVSDPTPTLSCISPMSGTQGTVVNVTLTGTGFSPGLTVNAGSGIGVSAINVISETWATATLTIGGSTVPGSRTVMVTTAGGVSNPLPFAVIANHAPVAADDSFKVDKGGTLNVPSPGLLGNDMDVDDNPIALIQQTAPIHGSLTLNADGSFSYAHDGGDVISDSFTYKLNDGMADSNLATVTLNIEGLFVNQFQPSSSGFVVELNRAVDASVLNLYSTETAGFGPPDVTLVGVAGGLVSGSLVVSGNGEAVTFIRTGGVLPPDTYTATLRSAADGFKSPSVGLLDGNHDGLAGDSFSTTFTVANPSAVIVSVPDFARGPGQLVDLTGPGIPVTLTDGIGVSQVDLVLKYDPNLLLLSAVLPGAGLPPGTAVQADFGLPDRVHITVTSAFPLNAGSAELVRIAGQVPYTAPYGASQTLSFTSLSLNSGAIPVIGDDGLHVAAFIGDTTGNGSYSSLDAQRILRVVSGLDSGFAAYARIDPVVVADITGNGGLSSLDATRLLQEVVGIDRPEIPPLP